MKMIPRMKAERLKRNWNQTTLAFFARMSPADVSRIETRRMIPYATHVDRLSKVLGIAGEELLEEVEVPQ